LSRNGFLPFDYLSEAPDQRPGKPMRDLGLITDGPYAETKEMIKASRKSR
jgi:hypothetical protein